MRQTAALNRPHCWVKLFCFSSFISSSTSFLLFLSTLYRQDVGAGDAASIEDVPGKSASVSQNEDKRRALLCSMLSLCLSIPALIGNRTQKRKQVHSFVHLSCMQHLVDCVHEKAHDAGRQSFSRCLVLACVLLCVRSYSSIDFM